jgi:trehalose-6-phosphate synthase
MPLEERRERHAALFRVISENDIHWWGAHFLAALTKDAGLPLVREPFNVAPPLYSDIA